LQRIIQERLWPRSFRVQRFPLADPSRTAGSYGRACPRLCAVLHVKAIGMKYAAKYAIHFEARHFPDSPNHPNFPSTEIIASHPLH
jgi:hypothetical protein